MNSLSFLTTQNTRFPSPDRALNDPNGLLAIGGDLTVERLIEAYYQGIFPWFNHEDPILWWSPDPRAIFIPGEIHVSKSLKKTIKKNAWKVTINQDFANVVRGCAAPREKQDGTWITSDIFNAYLALHHTKIAHSIEVWQQNQLIGGLYGVAIGQVFCGESMFHSKTNASKLALIALEQHILRWGFKLIDAQIINPHLTSLGAKEIPRNDFIRLITDFRDKTINPNCWQTQEVYLEFK